MSTPNQPQSMYQTFMANPGKYLLPAAVTVGMAVATKGRSMTKPAFASMMVGAVTPQVAAVAMDRKGNDNVRNHAAFIGITGAGNLLANGMNIMPKPAPIQVVQAVAATAIATPMAYIGKTLPTAIEQSTGSKGLSTATGIALAGAGGALSATTKLPQSMEKLAAEAAKASIEKMQTKAATEGVKQLPSPQDLVQKVKETVQNPPQTHQQQAPKPAVPPPAVASQAPVIRQ